jgi:hypothetical protein
VNPKLKSSVYLQTKNFNQPDQTSANASVSSSIIPLRA